MEKSSLLFICSVFLLMSSPPSNALTTQQLFQWCNNEVKRCLSHGGVQAYLGGAFDTIGVIKEKYNKAIFCGKGNDLFNMEKILAHLFQHRERFNDENAIIGVFDYVERYGACPSDKTD